AKHARKVTSYADFETGPLRTLARLLIESGGDTARALALARKAYRNIKHRCPRDSAIYALALEAAGKKKEALQVADEALAINDQMEEGVGVKRRLSKSRGKKKR